MADTPTQPTRKPTPSQGVTLDPRKMIGPVYGPSSKTAVPTVYMDAAIGNSPAKKTASNEPPKRFFGKYFPFFAGLTTFALVLFLLTICMDESRKLMSLLTLLLSPTWMSTPMESDKVPMPWNAIKKSTRNLTSMFSLCRRMLCKSSKNTEIRLQRFRLNMTRDEELNIPNNDPQLIEFIRWQLSTRKVIPTPLPQFHERDELVPRLASEVMRQSGGKKKGYFIQSVTHHSGPLLTAPYLAETFNWTGLIVEPDARKYFSLCKETMSTPNVQVFQACVSPKNHPKEVTFLNNIMTEREIKRD